MIGNPEFIKNIQLQINAVKMVLMPAVLGMIFIVVYLMNADSYKPVEYAMQVASLVLLGVIVFVWGTKMAVESLAGEFNDKTWDSQRMTAIDPWNLAWGKLFGSTLFAWYGGLFCLLVFTVSSFFSPKSYRFLELLLSILFAGVFAQATTLAFILTEFAKNRDFGKLNLSSYSVAGIIFPLLFFALVAGAYDARGTMQWYSITLRPMEMMLYSSVYFCLWGVIGFYRAMRKELQFDTGPWVWTLFVFGLMLYTAGFISNNDELDRSQWLFFALYISFFIGMISFYLMAFSEPKSIVDIRWLTDKAAQRKWGDFFVKLPTWFMSLLLVVLLCSVLLFMKASMHAALVDGPEWLINFVQFSPLAFLLFCLRDLGVILYVNLTSAKKNRDIVAIFYLIILYALVPTILMVTDTESILPWFFPVNSAGFLNSVVPVAAQTGFVFFLLYSEIYPAEKFSGSTNILGDHSQS
ncbi:hypothetical protein GKODMF_07515 [Candidatus Electrothrix gigas]